eukprot:11706333-Alexandrium_andersonii.AAC.1
MIRRVIISSLSSLFPYPVPSPSPSPSPYSCSPCCLVHGDSRGCYARLIASVHRRLLGVISSSSRPAMGLSSIVIVESVIR